MKKYKVNVPYAVWVTVIVNAESEEDAIDQAYIDSQPMALVGNGGVDKMIGVECNQSIEAGDSPLEVGGFSIDVEEVE